MVEITLTSKVSGRVIKSSYTARQLLETDEIDLVMDMTKCECEPIGETNVVECSCDDEWEQYELVIGEHDTEVKSLRSKVRGLEQELEYVHRIAKNGLENEDMGALARIIIETERRVSNY